MSTTTPNYAFILPDFGSDDDVWGDDMLNVNWAALDTLLKTMQDQIDSQRLPVGTVYLSAVSTNPNTLLGYGTWVAYAAGRAIVGVGSNGETTWTNGQNKGSETHTLTASQMPAHTHSANPPSATATSSTDGHHNHQVVEHDGTNVRRIDMTDNSGSGRDRVYDSSGSLSVPADPNDRDWWTDGAVQRGSSFGSGHTHSVTIDIGSFNTGSAGSGGSHNNVQPSIGTYAWRRSA